MEKEEAKKWAEELLNSRKNFEKNDFLDMLMFDRINPIEPNTMINLGDGDIRFEYLTKEQVVEKYGYLFTEEEKVEFLK